MAKRDPSPSFHFFIHKADIQARHSVSAFWQFWGIEYQFLGHAGYQIFLITTPPIVLIYCCYHKLPQIQQLKMIPIYDLINGSQHPLRFLLQIRNLGTVWLSWVLCFGEAKTKVWQDHVPFWNFWTQICTQSHSACWSNSVPCNGTEVSISLLAVSVCVCGGCLCS